MAQSDPIFLDAVVRVERLHPPGRDLTIGGKQVDLVQLADVLKVDAVESFSAKMTIAPFRGGIRVLGSLTAQVVQQSVVSLEPVGQQVDEPIDRIFMPTTGKDRDLPPGAEVFVDLEDDVPDELDGPDLDVTELLIETVALAIDPYPRAPGESLQSSGMDLDDGVLSPFEGLKRLKDPDGKA